MPRNTYWRAEVRELETITIEFSALREFQDLGISPADAHILLTVETERRRPDKTVIIRKSDSFDGFEIVLL